MAASGNVTEKYLTLPGDVLVTIRPNKTTPSDKTYSLPDIHGDAFATTNAAGTLLTTEQTGPFGEQLSGQATPSNTGTATTGNATFGYVGQHEKITESSFTIQPVQMGARVYVSGLGRFLSVDPQQGGTANNYVYVLDSVNDFDLDGNFGWKSMANIASFASMLPGPAGMVASSVAAASYAAAGDKKQALIACAGIAAAAVGAGAVLKVAKIARTAKPFQQAVGINSKLFGSGASYKVVGQVTKGLLNKSNVVRMGWQGNQVNKLVFRVSIGPAPKYAAKMSKFNPIKYIPHKHIYTRKW